MAYCIVFFQQKGDVQKSVGLLLHNSSTAAQLHFHIGGGVCSELLVQCLMGLEISSDIENVLRVHVCLCVRKLGFFWLNMHGPFES